MNLMEIVNRPGPPEPWSEGDNIPWNEPGFSSRMLKEHLSQDHDMASRRLATIDRHVAWVHATLLGGQPGARILDLGCGPGLYGERLSLLGHHYTGIDFSPASVEFARSTAENRALSCTYLLGDLREMEYDPAGSYDLAMQIFGEINVFRPSHARTILNKVFTALKPGGYLLLEASTEESLRRQGPADASWFTSVGGLFSAHPHLVLEETFWEDQRKTLTSRYYVIDAATAAVERFASSSQAYTNEEYIRLVTGCGFTGINILPALAGTDGDTPGEFLAIIAQKPQP
jgi:SAM-dependent methyltransferase